MKCGNGGTMSIQVGRTGLLLLLGASVVGCDDPTRPVQRTDEPATAAANRPLHEGFIDDPSFALPDIDCGTFTIRETSFSDRVEVTTYFDRAGNPTTLRIHVQFK